MEKKKLLICLEDLRMNGVMTSFKEFIKVIDRNYFDVYVFLYTTYGGYYHTIIPNDVTLLNEIADYKISRDHYKIALRYALTSFHWWLGLKRFYFQIARRLGKDIDSSFITKNAPIIPGEYDIAIGFVPTLFTTIQEKVSAKKRVIWLHTDYRYTPDEWKYAKFDKIDALVCVGKGIEGVVESAYPFLGNKLFTVHNALNFNEIKEKANHFFGLAKKSTFRLVTVGRFSNQKNQTIIPKIAKILKRRHYSFEWLLVGDDAEYIGQCTKLSCEQTDTKDVIIFLGQQENPHPIVKSADIVIVPSIFEGWGLVVSEALVLGIPVLVSDIPAFHEQCLAEDIIPIDEHAFADAIAQRFDTLLLGEKLNIYDQSLALVTPSNVKREFEEMLTAIGAINYV